MHLAVVPFIVSLAPATPPVLAHLSGYVGQEGGATADIAAHAYWTKKTSPVLVPTGADATRAAKALEWARALTDADIADNDYLYNLRAVCTDDYIRPKRGGLATSVIVAAERAFEKVLEKARDAQKSNEHVGNVKERLTLPLTLVGTREIEGYYGCSTLHRFEDAAGTPGEFGVTNTQPAASPPGTVMTCAWCRKRIWWWQGLGAWNLHAACCSSGKSIPRSPSGSMPERRRNEMHMVGSTGTWNTVRRPLSAQPRERRPVNGGSKSEASQVSHAPADRLDTLRISECLTVEPGRKFRTRLFLWARRRSAKLPIEF